jgi:hypothetical protein
MQLVIVNLDSLELIVQSALAQINAQLKENVLIGHAFAMLDSWEMIVHSRDVKVVVDLINTVMTDLVLATLVTLALTVISEPAPMIVSDMVIASMAPATVVQVGLEMIVH